MLSGTAWNTNLLLHEFIISLLIKVVIWRVKCLEYDIASIGKYLLRFQVSVMEQSSGSKVVPEKIAYILKMGTSQKCLYIS